MMMFSTMNTWVRNFVFFIVTMVGAAALASPRLDEAVDQAFAGRPVGDLTVDKHGFYLPQIVVTRTADGAQIEGKFRHRIFSKDDVVEYRITVEKGKQPRGVITKVTNRGLKENALVKFADKHVSGIADIIGDAQKWRVGSWEFAAQKVVDAVAQRLAQDMSN